MDNQSNGIATVENNGQHVKPASLEQPETIATVETVETEEDEQPDATQDWEKQSELLMKSACKRLKRLERDKFRGYLLAGRDVQSSLNLSIANKVSRKVATQVLYGEIAKATGRDTTESFVSHLLSCWAIVSNLASAEYLEALENGKQAAGPSWDGLKRIASCVKRTDSDTGDVWDIGEKASAVENGAIKLEALVRQYLAGGMSAAKIEEEYKSLIKPAATVKEEAKPQTGAGRNPDPAKGTDATTEASKGISLAPAPTGSASTVPSVQDAQGKASAGSPPKPLISTTPAKDAESILELVKGSGDPATVAERMGNLLARSKDVFGWKLLAGFLDCADDDALSKLHIMVQKEAHERAAIKSRKAVVDAQTRNSIALGKDATEAHAEEEQPAKIVA